MFPSTLPMDASEPDGPSMYPDPATPTQLSSLSPSLLQDLLRFEPHHGDRRALLEVLAAGVRHTQALAVRLAAPRQEFTLSVFPLDRVVHCPMPLDELLAGDLAALRVLAVRPALMRPPGDAMHARIGHAVRYAALAPLLWAVALRGARGELLPELAGQAAYRVAPGIAFGGLYMPAAMAACIARLRRETCNLRELSEWHGIGRERAMRLLNALYLQSALIVSRTHPAATNEGWEGYR
jgi:hypothetical protein